MSPVGTGTLSQRWHDRPQAVDLDPDSIFTALLTLSGNPEPGTTLDIHHDDRDPLIVVTEDDRSTQIRFTALIDRLNRSGTPDTTEAITDAIQSWADTRPVSDTVAADRGIATVIRYDNDARWQVVVPRPSGALAPWVPATTSTPTLTRTIRDAALGRAAALTITAIPTGRVTVWSYLPQPRLSPSVLARPEVLRASTSAWDATVVLTPGRPLAVADYESATRLVAEVNQPHLMFPLDHLNDLGWI